MSDIVPDLGDISGTAAWVAAHAAALRRRPATARARRAAKPATDTAAPQPRAPTALRDAQGRPLALLDRVRIGGPNEHHGTVQVLGFSVKSGRSVIHYGVGFPNTVSFWCFCAECVKED